MGGRFAFTLKDSLRFDKTKYLQAIKEVRKLKAPEELYVSSGQQDMGVSLIIKVKHKAGWTLLLPTNPVEDEVQCSFTYGIVSRRHVWDYVKAVLCTICRAVPGAFEFAYEDRDMEECSEIGFFDYKLDRFVVEHHGLPAPDALERLSAQHPSLHPARLTRVPNS